MSEDFTKEEWEDLCHICNPIDTMDAITVLREHDKKLISEFVNDLKRLPDGIISYDLIKKWEEKLK